MADTLNANVWVDGVLHRKGDTPPAEVAEKVTNPKVWSSGAEPKTTARVEAPEVKEPPRGGPGSSADAWRAFMVGQGFDVPEGATAKDMQSSWDARNEG
jgi:hypothetical protein